MSAMDAYSESEALFSEPDVDQEQILLDVYEFPPITDVNEVEQSLPADVDEVELCADSIERLARAKERRLQRIHGPKPESPRYANDNYVGTYLRQINQEPLLTKDDEIELAKTIEDGKAAESRLETAEYPNEDDVLRAKEGAMARDRFIRANLRFGVRWAKRYPELPGIELMDKIQEASLAIEKAVDQYDWRKGFRFSTFAKYKVHNYISHGLTQKGTNIRLPHDRAEEHRVVMRDHNEYGAELSPQEVELDLLVNQIAIDQPIDSSQRVQETPADRLTNDRDSSEKQAIDNVALKEINLAIDSLESGDQKLLKMYYGTNDQEPMSYSEISRQLGLNYERVEKLIFTASNEVRVRLGLEPEENPRIRRKRERRAEKRREAQANAATDDKPETDL